MNPLTRLRQFGQSNRRPRPLGQHARWRRLRQFAWVAFITVLVWVWADLEQTTSQSINVTIKILPPPGSNLRVDKPDPKGVDVFVTLRGAQGRITDLRRTMQEAEAQSQDITCKVEADLAWERTHDLDVLRVLNQWELLQRFHVTAVDATPKTIRVETDRWVQVEAQVEIRTNDDAALQRDLMPPPPKVTVRIPESKRGNLPATPAILTELIDVSNPREFPPGKEVPKTVALEKSIDGIPIQFVGKSTADVALRVGSRTITEPLNDPVSVRLLIDPDLMKRITRERYELSSDDSYPDEWEIHLTLSGTRKRLNQVSADRIIAFVRVTESDLEPADTHPPRPVEFLLPEGVTLAKPESAYVHFKYVRPTRQP